MSRNTKNFQIQPGRYWRATALSGCIASLVFPILPTSHAFAAGPDEIESGVIESTAPGQPSESSIDRTPPLEPSADEPIDSRPTLEPGAAEAVGLDDVRFSCMNRGGEYTVMYQPESRPGEGFPWAVPQAMGGGWDAESRCLEISRRLEEYRPDGLVELKTGQENGYNTLCVTTEDNSSCRIVLTVPPNQDPIATRNAVFDNLLIADTGEQTTGVTTYAGGAGDGVTGELINLGSRLFGRRGTRTSDRGSVRLKPFLDRADGGSATALKNGVRIRQSHNANAVKGRQLNPEQFR